MRRRHHVSSTSAVARCGSALVIGAVLTLGVGSAQAAFAADSPDPTTSSASGISSASSSAATTSSTTAAPSASATTSAASTSSASSTTPSVTSTVALAASPKQKAAASAKACSPGPITVKPTIKVSPDVVHAGDIVKLTIKFTQPNPCPGDHLDITMPPQFTDIGDFSFPFVDPKGNVLGTATIKNGKLTVVLSDQVAGMSKLTLTGSYNQRISQDATQGQNTLTFPTSGGNVPVPITVLPCTGNCQNLPTKPSKSGKLVGDHLEMIGQTPTFADPTTYKFVEKLTSPGQRFDCSDLTFTAASFTGKDANGQPTGRQKEAVTITSCSETQVAGTSKTSRPNSFARLFWQVQVTSDTVPSWTDELTISTTKDFVVTHEVKRQTGIGFGQGQFATTTTTSTTPSTTSTTTPSGPVLAHTGYRMMPLMVIAFVFLVLGATLRLGARRGSHS